MKKLWFTAKELAGLEGLPTSPQGINLMARREGWKNRRKEGYRVRLLSITLKAYRGKSKGSLACMSLR